MAPGILIFSFGAEGLQEGISPPISNGCQGSVGVVIGVVVGVAVRVAVLDGIGVVITEIGEDRASVGVDAAGATVPEQELQRIASSVSKMM